MIYAIDNLCLVKFSDLGDQWIKSYRGHKSQKQRMVHKKSRMVHKKVRMVHKKVRMVQKKGMWAKHIKFNQNQNLKIFKKPAI